jgi:hypothetical protein
MPRAIFSDRGKPLFTPPAEVAEVVVPEVFVSESSVEVDVVPGVDGELELRVGADFR